MIKIAKALFLFVILSQICLHAEDSWVTRDIGTTKQTGTYSYDSTAGAHTMTFVGGDMGGAKDTFNFTYVPLTGNGALVAHVSSLSGGGTWAKAGVMIRDSLDANAKNAYMMVSQANGFRAQYRETTGGTTTYYGGGTTLAPLYVKIERNGDLFISWYSNDGATWIPVAARNIEMGETVYVGLAVCSAYSTTVTGVIDQVESVPAGNSPTASGAWEYVDIGSITRLGFSEYDEVNQLFTMYGSGDIGGNSDAYSFLCQPFNGDGELIIRVLSQQNTNVWARSGVMFRETLEPYSKFAMTAITPGPKLAFDYRPFDWSASDNWNIDYVVAPTWLKIERHGDVFIGYYSADSISWTYLYNWIVPMGRQIFAGLPVTSRVSQYNKALLDQFSSKTYDPIPSPWVAHEINNNLGISTRYGYVDYKASTEEFTVYGGGSGISAASDSFEFLSKPITGDATIVAKLTSQVNTNEWAKAGLMIRETLNADSKLASITVTPSHGIVFERRAAVGASFSSTNVGSVSNPSATWLKLERKGNTFIAYLSDDDGATWRQVGSQTITMGATLEYGLATTSRVKNTLSAAVFSEVEADAAIQIINPVDGAALLTSSLIQIEATASTATGTGTITKVEFFANNSKIGESTTEPYTISTHLPAGSLTLVAKSTDSAGVVRTSNPVNVIVYEDSGNIGISDAWQLQYLGATGVDPNALTTAGNGRTYLQAYMWGDDPTDYYSQNGTIIHPSILTATAATITPLFPNEVAVQIKKEDGTPLYNAPVTFNAVSTGTFLSTTPGGTSTAVTTLTVRTDINGVARVYIVQSASPDIISVTAGDSSLLIGSAATDNSSATITYDGNGNITSSASN